ncbi:hypothetical protein AC579_9546 [Pseudocercospora musae]|uniref:Uncharacterized protein n=1 Tax=Pseudocercospora musae TaxID=113226 RepID=A0A139HE60_9PEZI|nr:hypothetical protein AC579_9546 [Pseudocercospora musae]
MAPRTFLQHFSRTRIPSRFASRIFIPSTSITSRFYSSDQVEAPEYLDANERRVFDLVKAGLEPSKLEVQDISGVRDQMAVKDMACQMSYVLDLRPSLCDTTCKIQGISEGDRETANMDCVQVDVGFTLT